MVTSDSNGQHPPATVAAGHQQGPHARLVFSDGAEVLAADGALFDVLGHASEDDLRDFAALLHPDDDRVFRRLLDEPHGDEAPIVDHHLRVRDAKGIYRVLIAHRASSDGEEAHAGDPGLPGGTVVELRDARREAHEMGVILTPITTVIMESTDDFIYFKSQHHILLMGSRSMVALCAPIRHWREFAFRSDYDVFPEAMADQYYALEQRVYAGEAVAKEIQPFVRVDGGRGWVDNRKYAIHDPSGRVIGLYGIARDITPQIEAVVARELAASVFAHSAESIVILDADGRIVEANEALCQSTGLSSDALVGKHLRDIKHQDLSAEDFEALWSELSALGHWEGQVTVKDPQGRVREEMARLSGVVDEDGKAHHYIALYSDITSIKEHEAELERIAHFDSLTGLANRELLADRLDQALAYCVRYRKRLAIAFMDLDGFKQVNDAHNHQVGDEFLVGMARHLGQALRDTDTLARIGGDEFVAVITELEGPTDHIPVVERLLRAATLPVRIATTRESLVASTSIGVSLYPDHGQDADILLRRADQAMYRAKQRGKNRIHHYESSAAAQIATREELQRAILEDQLVLHYQPKVNLANGTVEGLEALVRWQHPQRGLLDPADFLPLIDRENLSIELGEWVLRDAVRQGRHWLTQGLCFPISVNISGVHLLHGQFAELLGELGTGQDGAPELQIEILESSALDDADSVGRVITDCAKLGVRFVLDDFGTGFSSLTHLRKLPVASLKIDCSFVNDMLDDTEDFSIVSSIVALCEGLGREVTAEGVSSAEHARALLGLGCVHAQGYSISRPLPAQDIPAWINEWSRSEPWREYAG